MIDFILEYKWVFFIVGEIVFWGSLVTFFLLRYAFGLEKLSKYVIFVWLLSDLWLLSLGVVDYLKTGVFDSFQVIIIIVLIYALTFGKSDLQKLDNLIKHKVAKWKGHPLPIEGDKTSARSKHQLNEIRKLGIHLILYFVVIGIMAVFYGFKPLDFSGETTIVDKLIYVIGNGFINNDFIGNISGLWTLIIVVDTIYTSSNLVFSKRKQ